MANAVVILGAGASADFGVPTLAQIFKDRQARRYLEENPDFHHWLDQTFWSPRGHSLETSEESLTVEDMLTVLRDWEEHDGLDEDQRPDDLDHWRRKLYVLIERAVFQGKHSRARHLNRLIGALDEGFDSITWASFNWDCLLEASFWYSRGQNPHVVVDLDNWHNGPRKHTLLKLHGSVNWWMVDGQLHYFRFAGGGDLTPKWDEFDQGQAGADRPVILEPSAYKYHDNTFALLAPQWEVFFQRLVEADAVMVVGYSLPEGDQRARQTMLTAFQIAEMARWLVVDPSPSCCKRYGRLFGRERVRTAQVGLAGFNADLAANLRDAFPNVDLAGLTETDTTTPASGL